MSKFRASVVLGMTALGMALATNSGCKAGAAAPSSGGSGGSSQGGAGSTGDAGNQTSTGAFMSVASSGTGTPGPHGDPKTCADAAMYKTYLGCDFYPTVTANAVWSLFDFAAVVANGGDQPADVTVSRNGAPVQTVTVPPNSLQKIYLDWVPELKGPDSNACGVPVPLTSTVRSPHGAYHLVSSVPVTVYQFNALEYAPQGGKPGKDWSQCPAQQCGLQCFSYTNDASLLLPTTALTNNYRVLGYPGWAQAQLGAFLSITGTADGTNVTVTLSATGAIQAGGTVQQTGPGQATSFMINQGEVVELIGTPDSDFSGSLVQSTQPIEVIHGLSCTDIPSGVAACDHIEESILPAETLGKHYVVTVPTGPHGTPVGHVVRIVGNVNGTTLSYPSGKPTNAPSTINAGQVVDMGIVSEDFEVSGDHEFEVGSFQLGGSMVDPSGGQMSLGDPDQSTMIAVEQYRVKYVFLAPSDYPVNYADVVVQNGATLTLDGTPVSVPPTAVGLSSYRVVRIPLQTGANDGAHVIEGSQPFGIQVLGYGAYTSYQYPGGLNLDIISPPPPPPQ